MTVDYEVIPVRFGYAVEIFDCRSGYTLQRSWFPFRFMAEGLGRLSAAMAG